MSLDDEVEVSMYKLIGTGYEVEVDIAFTKLCGKIEQQLSSDPTATSFHVTANTEQTVVQLLVEYLTHHAGQSPQPIPAPLPQPITSPSAVPVTPDKWDGAFIDRVYDSGSKNLRDLSNLALLLECKTLYSLACAKWAVLISGKSVEEAREIFTK